MSFRKLKTAALLVISSLFFFGLIFPGFLGQTELPGDTTAPAPPGWSHGNQSFRLVMSLVFYSKWRWHPEIPETVPPRQWAFWTDGTWRGKGLWEHEVLGSGRWTLFLRESVLWRTYHFSLPHWTVHRTYTTRFPRSSKDKEREQDLDLFSLLMVKQSPDYLENPSYYKRSHLGLITISSLIKNHHFIWAFQFF